MINVQTVVNSNMTADWTVVLALSLTVNGCVFVHCLCLKGRSYLAKKCCCSKYNVFIVASQVYADKPEQLARRVTEHLLLALLTVFSFILISTSGVISSPFRSDIDPAFKVPIQTLLGIYLGKYIYVIAHHMHVPKPANTSRLRIDIVHHLTTIICYSIFVIFMQNLLLALVGITMEMNTMVIDFSRIAKDMNENKTSFYRKLSIVGCGFTAVFRGAIPFAFLVICIFKETPFAMRYAPLTAFFVSLIFFSVINVWLILNSVQRLFNVYRYDRMDTDYTVPTLEPASMRNNNLGYVRSYDNRNINNCDDEKLNLNKKNFAKETIRPPFVLNLEKLVDNRSVMLPSSPDDENLNNERINASRIRNDIGSLRQSTDSSNSDTSDYQMIAISPEFNDARTFRPLLSSSTDQSSSCAETCTMTRLPSRAVKCDSAESDSISSEGGS
ncbi:uncharacterized protein [Argopecten irradians]|uniref:uncharacterized protein n=1 Tax=Argopecten irradians TaxID=31199 RepID=UPI00371B18C9